MSHTDGDNGRPKLDVYARPFIPQTLKDVNLAPANKVPSTPARWVDFSAYVQTFAGSNFLTAGPSLSQSRPSRQLPHEDCADPSSLRLENYKDYFELALELETDAQLQECEDHALFKVPITKNGPTDPRPSMYSLHVPGLRELSLRIEIGDIVQLRQLRFNSNGEVVSGSLIKDAKGKPVKLPRHADNQYDAVVWGIDRLRETLSLRVDSLIPRTMLFNVCFTLQHGRLNSLHRAVTATQDTLKAASNVNWMRSMLFPEQCDGYYQKTLNKATTDLDLYDQLLNYQQLKAVNTVLNETYGPVPYIISGPPGTGKTKTIVELALQLVSKRTSAHLLVCAPSDPAADTLIQRLSKHLKPPDLMRINTPSRSFPEVPNTILPYCFIDDGMFSLPTFKQLMRCKIVVTTCRDVDVLLQARLSNADLCALQRELYAAIHPNETPVNHELHWTGLLIDEAAQATEPEALIPLSFIAPPSEHMVEGDWAIFVMAGDQHQLGPRNASNNAAMNTSLFERLLNRPFYRDHALARSKQSGGIMRPLTQDMLPILRPAFTNLIQNYRSHPAILATPSRLCYNDTLEPEAADTDGLLSWSGWARPGWPVLFHPNTSADEIEQDGGGWYNIHEAQLACQHAHSFLQSGLLQPHEICIMSPFRAQVRVLRKIARSSSFAMPGVSIGPLEAFQGLESRLVILCTTRTRDRFIEQDVAKGLGVIHEPRRFNVALTRAKEGLIVIGNPHVLKRDENWRTFLAFCWRNGLVEGGKEGFGFGENGDEAFISKLEKRLLHSEGAADIDVSDGTNGIANGVRTLGYIEDSEQELWRSGVAAERSMR